RKKMSARLELSDESDGGSVFQSKAIQSHVDLLHSCANGIEGKLVVSVFNEGAPGVVTHHRVGDVESMVTAIEAHATTPGANPYCGLHLMRPDLPRGQRGKERDIVAM